MAQRVHQANFNTGNMGMRDAFNAMHATFAGSQVHNDGPDYNVDPVGSSPWPSTARCTVIKLGAYPYPTTVQQATDFLLAFRDFYNTHRLYADENVGDKWFAHKVPDTTNVITLSTGVWSNIEPAMLEAARLLVNDLCQQYVDHYSNTGAAFHNAADTVNTLSTPITFPASGVGAFTGQNGVERTNLLKALMNDHFVNTTGGVHSAPDAANPITSPNATYDMVAGIGWPAWITLLTELKADFNAHILTVVHDIPDVINAVAAAVPTTPAGLFDMDNEIITDWGAHVASTTYHNSADAAAALVIATVSTLSHRLTLAQELHSKYALHVDNAPATRSLRLVS